LTSLTRPTDGRSAVLRCCPSSLASPSQPFI
jgi:hypothetical protein